MSSFVWMKVLESTPERYDRGIRLLSKGRIDEVYERIASIAGAPGKRVLDLGCGTGNLSLACAARGARVVGVDRSAGMLEVARSKPTPPGGGNIEYVQASVAEIEDYFEPSSFDAVVSCLLFSELSSDEQAYALSSILTRLKPAGDLLIADEVAPKTPLLHALYSLRRLPRAALAYVLTQTSTRPVEGLDSAVQAAGFVLSSKAKLWSDTFIVLHATRGAGPA